MTTTSPPTGLAPSYWEKTGSTLVSFAATAVIFVISSLLLGLVGMLAFVQGVREVEGAAATSPALGVARALSQATPAWFTYLSFVLSCVVAVVAASRMGRGTVGDAVFSLKATGADGGAVSAWQQLLRAGLPVAVVAAGSLVGLVWMFVVVALAGSLYGLTRGDRRGVYELASGVVQHSTAAVKGSPDLWREEARRSRDSQRHDPVG